MRVTHYMLTLHTYAHVYIHTYIHTYIRTRESKENNWQCIYIYNTIHTHVHTCDPTKKKKKKKQSVARWIARSFIIFSLNFLFHACPRLDFQRTSFDRQITTHTIVWSPSRQRLHSGSIDDTSPILLSLYRMSGHTTALRPSTHVPESPYLPEIDPETPHVPELPARSTESATTAAKSNPASFSD